MGEYADYEVDRLLSEQGCFSSYGKRRHRAPTPKRAECAHCGSTDVKWRMTDNGWRLFDTARGEHNRCYEHECTPPTVDDFEDVS